MDAMVTARMPEEKKRAGNRVIAAAGKTPSKLIGELYDFIIDEGRLPDLAHAKAGAQDDSAHKALYREFIVGSALAVPASFWADENGAPISDEELLASALEEKHGSVR